MTILETIEKCALDCLPSKGGSRNENQKGPFSIPGWSEHVKPYCDESRFWHAVWKSTDRPQAGPLFDMKVHSKNLYRQDWVAFMSHPY